MSVTVYKEHKHGCQEAGNRYSRKCHCMLYYQYQYKGKQRKVSARTRSWSTAIGAGEALEKKLDAGEQIDLQPIPPTPVLTVRSATDAWLKHRIDSSQITEKPRLMADKLVDWCDANNIEALTSITTQQALTFRQSLPYKRGNSQSLKIHWSIISSFFAWASRLYGFINPVPNPRTNPQFRINYERPEVIVASPEDIALALHNATGHTRVLMQLMRETGMALVDAWRFGVSNRLEDRTLIHGKRTKTKESFRVRISPALAEQLTPAMFQVEPKKTWRFRVRCAMKDCKALRGSHGFRHYRISEWRSVGLSFDDISVLVGTSPVELRRTYAHLTSLAENRMDEIQHRAEQMLAANSTLSSAYKIPALNNH